jgi:hypothetical protein
VFLKCGEARAWLVEVARGGACSPALRSHLDECGRCTGYLEEQCALTASFAQLVNEDVVPDPAEFAGPVMAAIAARKGPWYAGWAQPRLRWAIPLVFAALCLMMVRTDKPTSKPVEELPFVAIPYTVPLSPEERTTVRRMEIPVPELKAAGFYVQAADPTAVVEADALVGQDGRVRAIRPISVLITN